MPRTGRGGRREGTPGVAHRQRTDLNRAPNPAEAAVKRIPGQAYGAQAAQVAVQQAAPLPTAQASTQAAPTAAPAPGLLGAGMADLPGLLDPTTSPNEPLTAGVDFGPGPGRSALGFHEPAGGIPPVVGDTYADLMRWKPWLPGLVQLASQRGTPAATRAFVLKLTALMPEDH